MIDGDESYLPKHPLNQRSPKRIDEILELISKIWHKNPDLRLCQLIGNCVGDTKWHSKDLYYLEDNELQEMIMFYNRKE